MKYSRKNRLNKKRTRKNKFNKSNKRKRLSKQSGGFIDTMLNVAMTPVRMIAAPLMNKLGKMMSSNNSLQMNNSAQMNNSMVDHGTLNNIRMNNSHINTIKQLSSYGYDSNTMNSYIQQLQHINI
tara:strand:- start:181 stop:555 length:375 start_codon:yes stop_codon:yes gene_type:complete